MFLLTLFQLTFVFGQIDNPNVRAQIGPRFLWSLTDGQTRNRRTEKLVRADQAIRSGLAVRESLGRTWYRRSVSIWYDQLAQFGDFLIEWFSESGNKRNVKWPIHCLVFVIWFVLTARRVCIKNEMDNYMSNVQLVQVRWLTLNVQLSCALIFQKSAT